MDFLMKIYPEKSAFTTLVSLLNISLKADSLITDSISLPPRDCHTLLILRDADIACCLRKLCVRPNTLPTTIRSFALVGLGCIIL